MSVPFAVEPPAGERVEHLLQIRRQRRSEFHSSAIPRVVEDEPRSMQERSLQVGHRPDVARYAAMDAAVQRIADDRMSDGAEMHPDLMGPARVDGDLAQRQSGQVDGSRNAGDGFARAARARRHLLAVDRVTADGRVDPSAGLHHSPYEGDVLLLD